MVANILLALRRLGHGDSRVIAWVRMSQNGKKKKLWAQTTHTPRESAAILTASIQQ